MAKEAQRVRRRERKNISSGVAHVNSTFNNTMITVTDAQGSAWTQRFAILISGDPLPVDPVSVPLVWKGNGTSHTWNNTVGNQMWLDGETPGSWGDTENLSLTGHSPQR